MSSCACEERMMSGGLKRRRIAVSTAQRSAGCERQRAAGPPPPPRQHRQQLDARHQRQVAPVGAQRCAAADTGSAGARGRCAARAQRGVDPLQGGGRILHGAAAVTKELRGQLGAAGGCSGEALLASAVAAGIGSARGATRGSKDAQAILEPGASARSRVDSAKGALVAWTRVRAMPGAAAAGRSAQLGRLGDALADVGPQALGHRHLGKAGAHLQS